MEVRRARHDLARCREIAAEISRLSLELGQEAVRARDAGASWHELAAALRGRWGTGIPDALGAMVPGGTSTTAVRTWVEGRR